MVKAPELESGWTYADPEQVQLAQCLERLIEWDVRCMDCWLYQSPCWKGFPRVRQKLMLLRQRLTAIYRQHANNDDWLSHDAKMVLIEMHRLALSCKELVPELKLGIESRKMHNQRRAKTKLTLDHERRMHNLWLDALENGQKYGAQKTLATRYGVSVGTVKKVVKKFQAGE
jgi:hypothetical protein